MGWNFPVSLTIIGHACLIVTLTKFFEPDAADNCVLIDFQVCHYSTCNVQLCPASFIGFLQMLQMLRWRTPRRMRSMQRHI